LLIIFVIVDLIPALKESMRAAVVDDDSEVWSVVESLMVQCERELEAVEEGKKLTEN